MCVHISDSLRMPQENYRYVKWDLPAISLRRRKKKSTIHNMTEDKKFVLFSTFNVRFLLSKFYESSIWNRKLSSYFLPCILCGRNKQKGNIFMRIVCWNEEEVFLSFNLMSGSFGLVWFSHIKYESNSFFYIFLRK